MFVSTAEYSEIAADPVAGRYLRRFVGADELMHDRPRWCLWLDGVEWGDITSSEVMRTRVDAVKEHRLASKRPATRGLAASPHLFGEIRQPEDNYLAIPAHVSEHRRYFTAAYFTPDVICGNANFMAPDPDGYLFGVLSSTMFITWMKTIGGRLESRIRFSNTFTYNTFPLPTLTSHQRAAVVTAAQGVLAARAGHPGQTLAQLYAPESMPTDVSTAHEALDRAVDPIFGLSPGADPRIRQAVLFDAYAALAPSTN